MKNLKYAIGTMALGLAVAPLTSLAESTIKASEEYPDFYSGNTTKGIDFVQSIAVLSPAYCSNVKGDVTIVFKVPGMTLAKTFCWQQTTKALAESSGYSLMFLPAYSPNLNSIEHLWADIKKSLRKYLSNGEDKFLFISDMCQCYC